MPNKNNSAFPVSENVTHESFHGLSKRELFAAMAMQGFCANSGLSEASMIEVAGLSVTQADELIFELNRNKGEE